MRRCLPLLFCLSVLVCALAAPGVAENRIALVIGNSAYATAPLTNPKNDASLMAGSLRAVGFEVTTLFDAGRLSMRRAMLDFGRRLRSGDAVGLFYYAGHGVQVDGENYLIPVDAQMADETEARLLGIDVNDFLQVMERGGSRISVVILDACRNNPFARSFRSGTRGLARVDAPRGTYIAYSTAPGSVAADGDGANSPYARALSAAITEPGLTIEQAFKVARRKVLAATGNRQVPWESSSITGDFYFAGTGGSAVSPSLPGEQSAPAREPQVEAAPEPQVAVAEPQSTPRTAEPERVTLHPDVWPVGKWPEGIVFDGSSLWVAESGQRSVAALRASDGGRVRRVPVGRLPVGMVTTSDGRVFATVVTDDTVWEWWPDGRHKAVARPKDYMNSVVGNDAYLWTLGWVNNSNAQCRVARVGTDSHAIAYSGLLAGRCSDMALAGDHVWIVHGSVPRSAFTMLDKDRLTVLATAEYDGFTTIAAANAGHIYAGGGVNDESGLVISFDPYTGLEWSRRVLPGEFTYAMTATDAHVIAIGQRGTIWVLDADDLSIQRVVSLDWGDYQPQSAIVAGDALLITTHRGQGDKGSVLKVEGWRPDAKTSGR